MFFISIAFGAPLFFGLAVLIESRLSNVTFKKPTSMIFYVSLMNILFLPLLFIFGKPSIPTIEVFSYYSIIATIGIAYLYPYYMAMKVIDTSIIAALFSLGQITIPIMSYFLLDEKLTLAQYIGFTIIVMASVALSIKGKKIPKLNKAFYYMMFSAIIISFSVVLEKYVLTINNNWVNLIFYPSFISGLLPFSFLFIKKWRKDIIKNFPPYKEKIKLFILNEFICFLGALCGIYALSGLSPTITKSIGATQPIFMIGISLFLLKKFNIPLKEKISYQILLKKIFCFILIILGVILVTYQ